jgi:uncharacterized C2H2 Zn-finger protein
MLQLRTQLRERLTAVEGCIKAFGAGLPEPEEPIRCGECGEIFKNSQGLGSHMVKVHHHPPKNGQSKAAKKAASK